MVGEAMPPLWEYFPCLLTSTYIRFVAPPPPATSLSAADPKKPLIE
jgi:hypothetical protein